MYVHCIAFFLNLLKKADRILYFQGGFILLDIYQHLCLLDLTAAAIYLLQYFFIVRFNIIGMSQNKQTCLYGCII